MTSGILWVGIGASAKASGLDPAVLLNNGIADNFVWAHNLDSKRPQKILWLFSIPDIKAIELQHVQSLLARKGPPDETFDIRLYELVQAADKVVGVAKPRLVVGGMVTTCVDVPVTVQAGFDEWFQKQHLDMVTLCHGFFRARRYKLSETHPVSSFSNGPRPPKNVTLYEYESINFPDDQLKAVATTKWSRAIIPSFTRVERDT